MKKLSFILLLMIACFSVHADIYQWAVKVEGYTSSETGESPEAFMWIPEDCEQVKAIVVSQQNMNEETIFNHPTFRSTMSDLGFAIVWIAPSIDYQWDVRNGCQEMFDKMLVDLADVSGYEELQYVPIVPLGHSAMATFPWNFAAWNYERTLAVVSFKGDSPRTNLTGYGRENLEWGRNRNIDGIPGLMIEGEYEWWEARVNPSLAFRMMYPESCISFLCDRGQGHFDASDKVVEYISLFLKKAAQYRLINGSTENLKKLNPKDGWLAERWRENRAKRAKSAPFTEYKGNQHDAFWYFDKEMAEATERYYKEPLNRKMHYIGMSANGKLLPFDKDGHGQYMWEPELGEDMNFNLKAVLTDSMRSVPVNGTASHSQALKISKINGPVEVINDTTFKVDFYRIGFNNPRRSGDIWLLGSLDEDNKNKNAVQQFNARIPYPLIRGERQYILFPGIPDVSKDIEAIDLKAHSDKNLTVSYYIKQGPAKIKGDKVVLTETPPRAKYPIKVTVVAWQYGVKGRVQSAEPVERDFYITN